MLPAGLGPIGQILVSPDLVTATVALLAALVARLTSRLKRQQRETDERISRMSAHVVRAANAAESASEGVHNNHTQNLRDDLDMKFDDVARRIDALTESVGALRDTVSDQSHRLRSLEGQVEGVRSDARADRVHLYSEVSDLHKRIDGAKRSNTTIGKAS